MYLQTCYLLSYIRYGDHDAVLHCFSKDAGYQSFFAKGIYSPKNKKKAYLFPLNLLQVSIVQKRNSGSIQNVSKIEMPTQHYTFDEVKINTVLMFVADFLNQVLRNETSQNSIYTEIERFTHELFAGNYDAYVAFIFRVLKLQGLSPLYGEGLFMDAEDGNFVTEQSSTYFDEEISGVWKKFIQAENVYNIPLGRRIRGTFLDSLMMYYKIHFSGFHEPHSLEIIQQIYE